MWEQRHSALHPHRTEGNTRYYDNTQLRRLLNLVSLQETGKRISELSPLTDQELFELLKAHNSQTSRDEKTDRSFFINQLLAAGMTYDAPFFEKMLAHCLHRFGMKVTYTKVIYPMLQRIGFLWATNELPPAQEHFMSNLLRQKLFTAIDSLPPASSQAPTWLLFLPENEFHELGLLMADYLLKSDRQNTLYLGANVPLSSVAAAGEVWPADNLLLFLVHKDAPDSIEDFLEKLNQHFPATQVVLAAGPGIMEGVNVAPDVKVLHQLSDLEELLKSETSLIN